MVEVINVGRFIDERPLSAFQIRTICLCALVIGLDGFDAQALGFVAPALAKDWQLARGALGPVFGASLFGVMIGSLLFGALADYFGRKWLVIAGVLVFALGTLATSRATGCLRPADPAVCHRPRPWRRSAEHDCAHRRILAAAPPDPDDHADVHDGFAGVGYRRLRCRQAHSGLWLADRLRDRWHPAACPVSDPDRLAPRVAFAVGA